MQTIFNVKIFQIMMFKFCIYYTCVDSHKTGWQKRCCMAYDVYLFQFVPPFLLSESPAEVEEEASKDRRRQRYAPSRGRGGGRRGGGRRGRGRGGYNASRVRWTNGPAAHQEQVHSSQTTSDWAAEETGLVEESWPRQRNRGSSLPHACVPSCVCTRHGLSIDAFSGLKCHSFFASVFDHDNLLAITTRF